jgi:hypothetical protein
VWPGGGETEGPSREAPRPSRRDCRGGRAASRLRFAARQLRAAHDTQENLFTVETALRAWADAHHNRYPPPERLTADDFGKAAGMDRWPANSWTGKPMAQSTAPGDFTSLRSPGGKGAVLTINGVDGPLSSVELGVTSQ